MGRIKVVNYGLAIFHQPPNTGLGIDDPNTILINAPSGDFEVIDRANVRFSGFGANNPRWYNQGLFHFQVASNEVAMFVNVQFNNLGRAVIDSGLVSLDASGARSSGEFALAAGTTLRFGGDHTLLPGSSIHGAGSVVFASGNVSMDGDYNVSGGTYFGGTTPAQFGFGSQVISFNGPVENLGPRLFITGAAHVTFYQPVLNLTTPILMAGGSLIFNNFSGLVSPTSLIVTNGGNLSGAADIETAGPVTLIGCTLTGAGRLITHGAVTMAYANFASSIISSQPREFVNDGVVAITGTVDIANFFRNLAGGVLDIQGDYQIASLFGTEATSVVINNGLFKKSAGTGQSIIEAGVHNTGLIDVISGTMVFDGGLIQLGGELRLDGGNVIGYPTLEFQAGSLTGSGKIDVYQLNNSGATLAPSSTNSPIGSFHMTTEYHQTAGATFAVDIASTDATVGFDQIKADTVVTLDGSLAINLLPGYTPQLGDSFRIISTANLTGHFAQVIGDALGGGLKMAVNYDSQGVTLKVVTAP
jgi:hypothetical protein